MSVLSVQAIDWHIRVDNGVSYEREDGVPEIRRMWFAYVEGRKTGCYEDPYSAFVWGVKPYLDMWAVPLLPREERDTLPEIPAAKREED